MLEYLHWVRELRINGFRGTNGSEGGINPPVNRHISLTLALFLKARSPNHDSRFRRHILLILALLLLAHSPNRDSFCDGKFPQRQLPH